MCIHHVLRMLGWVLSFYTMRFVASVEPELQGNFLGNTSSSFFTKI